MCDVFLIYTQHAAPPPPPPPNKLFFGKDKFYGDQRIISLYIYNFFHFRVLNTLNLFLLPFGRTRLFLFFLTLFNKTLY